MLNYAAGSSVVGYNLTRSLRFRASASAFLSRTPASAGNRKTWTWSAWVKRGTLSSNQVLFISKPSGGTDATFTTIGFTSSNTLLVSGLSVQWKNTTQVFRDPSAWYHIVITWDTTQATASNRVRVYVNGSQVTAFGTTFDPSLNFDGAINQADVHALCAADGYSAGYFDGYLAEVNFIDGQALTPSSFGSTNALTGVWQPAPYTGTYGTNGFYLPFTDNSALTTSSNVGLGRDYSGNGNYWTTNNISITAGVTYDSMTDVPTLTSATAANYAVLNPLQRQDAGYTTAITNGNLAVAITYSSGANMVTVPSTIKTSSSGKWYWEINITSTMGVGGATGVGIITPDSFVPSTNPPTNNYLYIQSGNKSTNGTSTSYGATFTNGDVIGVALDVDAGTLEFYKNDVSQGVAFTGLAATSYYAVVTSNATGTRSYAINFGQRPFAHTPPTGFVALNAFNLPTATILKGSDNFNIALATGANIKTNSEAIFPSNYFEWIKDYVNSNDNQLANIVTGNTAILVSNSGAAETTYTTPSGNSVGWVWKANGSAVSNTNGSITSQVSANTSSGFSIVTFNGTGAAATVGHGLNVAPEFIIAKRRNNSDWWFTYSAAKGNTGTMYLNQTTDDVQSIYWNNTTPTSSVFSVGSYASSGNPYLALCFASISGYSSFGQYIGNGSTDGTFVYTGFRPRWIMIRKVGSGFWLIYDTSRDTYNVVGSQIYANLAQIDAPSATFDILSNGFKLRSSDSNRNANGATIFYAAFAENPFKHSLAR